MSGYTSLTPEKSTRFYGRLGPRFQRDSNMPRPLCKISAAAMPQPGFRICMAATRAITSVRLIWEIAGLIAGVAARGILAVILCSEDCNLGDFVASVIIGGSILGWTGVRAGRLIEREY